MKLRMKKVERKNRSRYDITALQQPTIKQKVSDYINGKSKQLKERNNIQEEIDKFEKIVEEVKEEFLKPTKEIKKKSWMTEDILSLMEQRRTIKRNEEEYKKIQAQIRRRIREAKEKEAAERCAEIEILQARYDNFNVHKKVKEATGSLKKRQLMKITDTNGKIIIDKQDMKKRWKLYLETLFHDQRPEVSYLTSEVLTGPDILIQEVKAAIKQMKNKKAAGPDNIEAEFLKLLDNEGIVWITDVFNKIYNSGYIPDKWLQSEFIALPKKPGAKRCEEYRTISLMSHMLKLFLKVIHRRIYKKCEEQISHNQFGFMNAVGTREALFGVQVLFQRCRDVNCDVYACLIDYEKAFDRVQHQKMINILKDADIDDKELRIISNLYWNQTACMRLDGERTEQVKILRGVRQGCILSPLIFNMYSEKIFNEALNGVEEGVLLNGVRLNNIRYADDTIVMADSLDGLQTLMDRITQYSQQYGLNINVQKTKQMIISKKPINGAHLYISGIRIERVKQYCYLGTIINEQWDNVQEIKCRIGKAKAVFNKMSAIFKSHHLSLETKIRHLRCYVFSVLLYGVESWTLTEATTKKLEAFEMWLYRRILKIPWTAHTTNKEVLQRMKKDQEIVYTIKRRKLEYLGHVMRNQDRYSLLQSIMQGKIKGKRGPGRRRVSWLRNLRTWFGKTSAELFRAATNKVIIANMIANIRNG
jgi:Reverse transcriptase (RNA-dependent DNA polymerase)